MKHVEHVGRPAFVVLAVVVLASIAVGARALGPLGASFSDPPVVTTPATVSPNAQTGGPDAGRPTAPAVGASATVPANAQTGGPVTGRPMPPALATPTPIAEPTARRTLTTAPGDDRADDALQADERTGDDEGRRQREPDDREG